MRAHAVATAGLVLACLTLARPVRAAAPDPTTPRLTVDPVETVGGLPVAVTGSCPALPPPDDPDVVEPQAPAVEFPSSTDLTSDFLDVTVKLSEGGEFLEAVLIEVPVDAEPGEHVLTTSCGGEARFEVLAAPTLEALPEEAVRGQTVLVGGTCPAATDAGALRLDGTAVGSVAPAPTGRFTDLGVVLPDEAEPGEHTLTTDCGGSDVVVVTVPDPPTDGPDPPLPPDELVAVPNLAGLTSAQAGEVLAGAGLVPADPAGGPGRVVDQDPAPGATVALGSAVSIELRTEAAGEGIPPLVVAGGAAGLLVAGAPFALRGRRLGRERRWLRERVDVVPADAGPFPAAAPPGPAPGLDVRIEVHRARWPVRGGPE